MKLVYVMPGVIGKISLPTTTEIYGKLESFLESSGINYVDTPTLTNLGFGSPRTDTCSRCDMLQSPEDLQMHKQKAESAFQQQRIHRSDARSGHCAFISFDMEKAFYNRSTMHSIVSAIDCTHISIQSPGSHDAEIFGKVKKEYTTIMARRD